ncbi:hypothetical protein [Brevundimonas sp.]|uniref:hypothetical protein n=1 Tax=Brevundimonas sp. TaxID=1871086 RepID=UPI003562F95D
MTRTTNDISAIQLCDPTAATANNHVGLIRSTKPIGDQSSYPRIQSSATVVDGSSDMSAKPLSPDGPAKSAVAQYRENAGSPSQTHPAEQPRSSRSSPDILTSADEAPVDVVQEFEGLHTSDFDVPMASANAFIRNAFIVTPTTPLVEVQQTFADLKLCGDYWGARVRQGLAGDRLYVAMKVDGERLTHWAVYLRCTDPETFISTQASIASQLNHRFGKAAERWDGDNARHRTFGSDPAERVRLHRRSGEEWGAGSVLILSRKFQQQAEQT